MLLSQQLIGLLLVTLTHGDYCPIFFDPLEVVVEYRDSVSVNCTTNITHQALRWEASDAEEKMTEEWNSWTLIELTDWKIQPSCYIISNETQCSQNLTVTIYKSPDSVSIGTVDQTGPVNEDLPLNLQCDNMNVAVQNLTVRWYKGKNLLHHENFTDTIKTPVNISVTLQISPVRANGETQYRCEAELQLGAEGPQPPPSGPPPPVTSKPLNTVLSKHTQCPIDISPQRAVVRYNSSVSVNCSTDVTHDGIGWEASERAVPMIRDKSLITWSVLNLREWDIRPFCYINYDMKQCEDYLPVTVYKTPDSVSISTVDHTGPVTEGSMLNLQCDIMNVAPVQNLTVRWYKGETLLHHENFTDTIKTPMNISVTHKISPVRADDGAQYRCEAVLELGAEGPQPPPTVTSEPLSITVHYAPNIDCKDWSPKIWTPLSSYLSLYSVVGNPPPKISWSRGSSSVDNLTLHKSDSGQYNITASNEISTYSCIINITVEYPPELNCSESYQIKENTSFEHLCSAYGIPVPAVSLYKDGKLVNLPYHAKWNDSGLYNLAAKNKFGTVYKTFILNILYAPRFPDTRQEIVVAEGSKLTLECNSSGNPDPDMWWNFKNANISTGRRYITLNIEKATSTSAGVYTCSATNKFGSKKKTYLVEIKANFPIYIISITVLFVLIILIIAIALYLWKKKKSRGRYDITELRPLSNGGPRQHKDDK